MLITYTEVDATCKPLVAVLPEFCLTHTAVVTGS
jgi:hypothetical protein